ncbi:hypothetical protein G7A72_03350 [Flavobacterium sp. Sr18]|uniref:hypothetical protein n=1 Tax=Flavobacterium sp. Sr18 TaxID=935222 RepID=UPI0013E465F4|nr:hypothetical protein [Flavobacterium sp. Sr18]QIH37894.1 hypothetical protein G7A72_03350 [Flavobacterium sp. Sr18]
MVTEQEEKIAAQIAKIKAQHQAAAEKEIEDYKLSFEVDQARKDLSNKIKSDLKDLDTKHKAEIKEFEKHYNVDYDVTKKDAPLPHDANVKDGYFSLTQTKCEEAVALIVNGKPKYSLNADNLVVGTKGEVITSTIMLPKTPAGKKRTLSVNALKSYMIGLKK